MSAGTKKMEYHSNETQFALLEQSIQHMTLTLQRFEIRFDKIDDEIKAVKIELKSEIRSNFFWTLSVIGTVLGIVAHGFHWI
jgi:hypothetical protein